MNSHFELFINTSSRFVVVFNARFLGRVWRPAGLLADGPVLMDAFIE
jgi:hypothetical protein